VCLWCLSYHYYSYKFTVSSFFSFFFVFPFNSTFCFVRLFHTLSTIVSIRRKPSSTPSYSSDLFVSFFLDQRPTRYIFHPIFWSLCFLLARRFTRTRRIQSDAKTGENRRSLSCFSFYREIREYCLFFCFCFFEYVFSLSNSFFLSSEFLQCTCDLSLIFVGFRDGSSSLGVLFSALFRRIFFYPIN